MRFVKMVLIEALVALMVGCAQGGEEDSGAISSASSQSASSEASSTSSLVASSSKSASSLGVSSETSSFASSLSHSASSEVFSASQSASSEGCFWEPHSGKESIVTTEGPIRGVVSGGAYAFLGIPFAQPPLGALRWQPPSPPVCRTDLLETINYRDVCPQMLFDQSGEGGEYQGSEDCLYLNLFAPLHPESDALPILFFIHGGGNVQGSASQMESGVHIYNGAYLAAGGDAIIVTINYRLGALGWLAHSELEDANKDRGNWGLQDQIAALKWVRANAAAFGGDAERIMIFGESGGAVDVCMLLVSAKAQGLFASALMQSGACWAKSLQQRSDEAEAFFEATGCEDAADVRACLMQLDAQTLVSNSEPPLSSGFITGQHGPVIDGRWIEQDPEMLLEQGNFNRVPFAIGSNADEMALAIAPGTVTPKSFELFVKSSLPFDYWDQALALYPPGQTNAAAREAKIHLISDAQFVCNARRIARKTSAYVPTWRYSFNHHPGTPTASLFGAFHGLELFYVFQTYQDAFHPDTIQPTDINVSETMGAFWKRMAAFGDPGGAGLPLWPAYTLTSPKLLELSSEMELIEGYRKEYCDFWDTVTASLKP